MLLMCISGLRGEKVQGRKKISDIGDYLIAKIKPGASILPLQTVACFRMLSAFYVFRNVCDGKDKF